MVDAADTDGRGDNRISYFEFVKVIEAQMGGVMLARENSQASLASQDSSELELEEQPPPPLGEEAEAALVVVQGASDPLADPGSRVLVAARLQQLQLEIGEIHKQLLGAFAPSPPSPQPRHRTGEPA